MCDVTLAGFNLPAGTLIMANFTSAHRSPEFWARPDEFYPQHFLDEDDSGSKLAADKPGFMPYGLGERICPGKELADMEMFLILTNLLTSYRLLVAPGDTKKMGTQVRRRKLQ